MSAKWDGKRSWSPNESATLGLAGSYTMTPAKLPAPAPAARHYVEAEYKSQAAAYAQHLQEEAEPPGPSPETVLHEVIGLKSLPASHVNPNAAKRPLPTAAQNHMKNVPARVRAIQAVIHAQQQSQILDSEGRPPSVAVAQRPASVELPPKSPTPTPSQLAPGTSAPTPPPRTFEEELKRIEQETLHKHSTAGQKPKPPHAIAKGGPLSQTKTSGSPNRSSSSASDYDQSLMDGLECVPGSMASPFVATPTPEEKEAQAKNTATGKPIHVPYTPDLRAKLSAASTVHTHLTPKPLSLRDYMVLAEACQRAGRARMEGHAYYKIAELLAKQKETLAKSGSYFKKYLNISIRLNDLQGEAKALNCLGIIHYELGGQENVEAAVDYHKRHAEIADAAGVFIANTNLGLCYTRLGNIQAAMECHKVALQYAVRSTDKGAEALALANLGATGTKQGDLSTARVCVERHLEIATTLHDNESGCEAYEQLGLLACRRGDHAAASENFLLALDIAVREKNQARAKQLRCRVGYAQGMLRMEEAMKVTAAAMGAHVTH